MSSNTHTSETSNSGELQLTDPKQTNILSTLAKENGWLSDDNNPLYYYQGFWYHGYFIQGVMAAHTNGIPGFNPSPSDILVSCNPKSGTTWLKALCFAISTRTRFPIARFEDHPLHSTNPHDLVPMIESYKFSTLHDHSLPFFSTHLPYTALPGSVFASGCKIVYIWRDPKDAFVSCWHFIPKLRANKDDTKSIPLEEAFDLFCSGVSPFGPFWDHVLGYWKAFLDHPDKILFLKYEDMMSDAEACVKRLAEFMGYPFSSDEEKEGVVSRIVEMCSFESLSNLTVKCRDDMLSKGLVPLANDAFYRKGKIGDWNNYLTEEMASKIDQITMNKLGSYGLTF